MTIDSNNRITVRMFIGCLFTSDLKLQLTHSHSWKESQIVRDNIEDTLHETLFQNKPYIGYYCEGSGKTLSEIEAVKDQIKEKITFFCPGYEVEKLKFSVFPQVFIS